MIKYVMKVEKAKGVKVSIKFKAYGKTSKYSIKLKDFRDVIPNADEDLENHLRKTFTKKETKKIMNKFFDDFSIM